jgi:hypothetical protein
VGAGFTRLRRVDPHRRRTSETASPNEAGDQECSLVGIPIRVTFVASCPIPQYTPEAFRVGWSNGRPR